MKLFHICTISNDLNQYQKMKASFLDAGFDEDRCRYSLFDNSNANSFDPYETFNRIKSTTVEPYIIFCHQDILLNQEANISYLIDLLKQLEQIDPNWAIAGNAGVNNHYQLVIKITDPNHFPNWTGSFPQLVHSLDENFLVIKTSASVSCSGELRGFHFYATDLCLNAIRNGHSCYVINFHITHLSGGKSSASEDYCEIQDIFYEKWCNQFRFCYVRTVTGKTLCLSNSKTLRAIGSRGRIANFLIETDRLRSFVSPY